MLVEQEILAVRYYFAQLLFDLQWANPLWVLTGSDPGAELERITARVKDSIDTAVDASVLRRPLSVQEILQVPTARPPWWFRIGRWIGSHFDWLLYASGHRL